MAKILIVEDDQELARLIVDWLNSQKYVSEAVHRGNEGLERLKFYKYDAVVLDWDLPEISGPEICRTYRNNGGQTPILMLTGKQELDEKEVGLDSGADDYLTKPFQMRELSARLRALLRRTFEVNRSLLSAGNLTLNPSTRQVMLNEEALAMQPKEFALLEFLLRHPNQPFSAEALMDRVWPSESDASPDTVRLHIMRLRKLIDEKEKQSIIRTLHRVGYMLVPPQESGE